MAPPKTVSMGNNDGIEGVRYPSRDERGITPDNVRWARVFQEALMFFQEDVSMSWKRRLEEAYKVANKAVPDGAPADLDEITA
jgi:hypothetical protein